MKHTPRNKTMKYIAPMKHYWLIITFLIIACKLQAQEFSPVGARAGGMGKVSSAMSDVWSVFNNPGAMGQIEKPCLGFYAENLYGLKDLSKGNLAFALPSKSGTWGLGISNYGSSLFSRKMFGAGYAKKFNKSFSGGIKLNYLVTQQAENYGRQSNFLVEAGVWYAATKNIKIGFHTFNPNRVKWSDKFSQPLQSFTKMGIQWQIGEQVLLAAEGASDADRGFIFRSGVEYKPGKLLTFRTGLETNPISNSFGVTYQYKNIYIDFASAYHYVLGFTTKLGISFDLVKKEKDAIQTPDNK
jgi:hypothetical protein